MHSPETVAFEIKYPFNGNKSMLFPDGYRKPFITIWHYDPEKNGDEDSCGWFMRERHGDKLVLDEIQKEFDFNFKNNYWFDKKAEQIFSTIGTAVEMYGTATWIYFKHNRRKQKRFMKEHLFDIIRFAENPFDCIGDTITNKWNCKDDKERFEGLAGMIYADIMRKDRKWYKHPKWHIWHWRIQFHPYQDLKRRFWDKCCKCGKRGFKGAAMGNWSGNKIWHAECENYIEI